MKEVSPIRKLLRYKDVADFLYLLFLATGIYIGYKNFKARKERDLKLDLEWLSVPKLKQKLFKCNEYYFPEFLVKNLTEIKDFKTRKEDVWIATFPSIKLFFQFSLCLINFLKQL